MSSDILHTIDRLDSRELRDTLGKLEQQRSAVIVLLRAAVARDRCMKGRRKEKKAISKGGTP